MTSRRAGDRPAKALSPDAARVRACAVVVGAAQADLVRAVATMTARLEVRLLELADRERAERSVFAVSPSTARQESRATVVDEVAVVLGRSRWSARVLVDHAGRLVHLLPDVLDALAAGRLDLDRVTLLLRATEHLCDRDARRVTDLVLAADETQQARDGVVGGLVWDLVQVPSWRNRIVRAVARIETRSDPRPVVPWLGVHVDDARHATLTVTGCAADVLALRDAVEDLTDALVPAEATGLDGARLRTGERLAAGLQLALAAAVRSSGLPAAGPGTTTRGRRELGVVLHVDTLLDDGPARECPGQVRGTGHPLPVPAANARQHAAALARGAGTCLLLADHHGRLARLLRVGPAPDGGGDRVSLVAAGRRALARAGQLESHVHDATVAVHEHVRAAHPVSCAPGTGASTHSASRLADLDHVVPWPHGPTTPANLRPLHRTPHRRKTRGLWHCDLRDSGSLRWTTLAGATSTHTDEPLPGYLVGEGHAPADRVDT